MNYIYFVRVVMKLAARLLWSNSKFILQSFLKSGKTRRELADESGLRLDKMSTLFSRDVPINYGTAQKLIAYFGDDAVCFAER